MVNNEGITPYVEAGVVTPGKGLSVLFSGEDPQQNTTTVNLSGGYILGGSVEYPAVNEFVPLSDGEVAVGFSTLGAALTLKRTFNTVCW